MTLRVLPIEQVNQIKEKLHHLKIPLRFVLIVPFLLLTAGTVGFVAYLGNRNGQQAVQDLADQVMDEVSDRVTLKIDSYLSTPYLINQFNTDAIKLNQLNLNNLPQIEHHFWQQMQRFDSVISIAIGMSDGEFTGIGRPGRNAPPNLKVGTAGRETNGYFQIYSTNNQGDRIGKPEIRQKYDPRQRTWYQDAVRAGKPAWSEIYPDFSDPRLVITANQPIFDQNQRLQGVLSIDLLLSKVGEFLQTLKVGQRGQIFVIEQSGLLVASSTNEQLFVVNNGSVNRIQATDSGNPLIRASANQLLNKFGNFTQIRTSQQLDFKLSPTELKQWQDWTAKHTGQPAAPLSKTDFLLQVTPLQDEYGLNWLILVAVPAADFTGQIDANTQSTMVLNIAALLAALILGLLLAHWIDRAVQRLSHASHALATGNWHQDLIQDSPIAELQVLTQSFRQTASQIQDSFDQVKTALQESEEKFSKVFRTCPDAIGIVTLDGQCVDVNDAFLDLFGYSKQEVSDQNMSQIGYWVNLADRQRYIQTLQAGEPVHNWELVMRHKNGNLLTVLFSAEIIELQGQPYIVGIAKDISDRKRIEDERKLAEAALRQNEARFQRLAAAAPGAIYTLVKRLDESFYFEYDSPAIEAIHELSVEQMLHDPALDLIHPDDQAGYQAAVAASAATLAAFSYEFRIMTPSGKLKWLQASSRPERRQNHEIAWYGIVLDVSERKQTEEALRQSEERNRAILTAIPDLMKLHTSEGIYLDSIKSNSTFDLIADDENLIGKHISEIIPLEIAARQLQLIQQAVATGEVQVYEQQIWFQNTPQYEEVRIVPCSGNTALLLIRNITDRKQAEEALRQSEERNRAILSAIPDLITLVSRKGIYLGSIRSNTLLDLVPDDVNPVGKHLTELLPPEVAAAQMELIQRALATGEVQVLEQQLVFEGKQQYEELRVVPYGTDAALIMIRNITDRKVAEEALRHSEAALRRAQQVAHVGSWELDLQTETVIWSEESFHIFGWDVAQPEPSLAQLLALIHPADRALLQQSIQQTSATQAPYKTEFRVVHADGSIRHVEARGEAIVNEQEQVTHLLGTNLDVTERVSTEEALRISEERWQLALRGNNDGIWDWNLKTNEVFYSARWKSMLGYQDFEILQHAHEWLSRCHPKDFEQMMSACRAHWEGKTPHFEAEYRMRCKDNTYKWVLSRGQAVWNEAGFPTRMVGSHTDISERKLTEEALRQSEANKNQILKAIPDLIVWMTADGTCIDLIEGNNVKTVVSQAEAIGKNIFDFLEPELAQQRIDTIQQALRTGEVQIYEQQNTVKGETNYEEIRIVAVTAEQVLTIIRDVTDRKHSEAERQRAEAALRESEERFRSAFRDAPIGMALISLDDRWLKVNPMLSDMLGYSEAELLLMNASALVHPEDISRLQACVEQATYENRNAQVELRYCCNEGRIAWGLLSLSLVRDAQNNPLYYVAQIQDITEQHAVDRMKNEFVSIVSHELRTPLTAIRGFLGLLNTGIYDNRPEKAKHMLGQALSNSERLVRLVNDILDLERLSSGRVQMVMEVCEAEDLMQRAVEGLQSIASEATITLSVAPTTAQVWAAPDSVIQTLTNLVGNAIKFSPPDSTVALAAQLQSDFILFQVKDQGRGIPADKLESIFGRFQQVDVSDARQKGGTGLGLAICQSIVHQHGGNIWAESTLGEGSTFYFTLPVPPGGKHD